MEMSSVYIKWPNSLLPPLYCCPSCSVTGASRAPGVHLWFITSFTLIPIQMCFGLYPHTHAHTHTHTHTDTHTYMQIHYLGSPVIFTLIPLPILLVNTHTQQKIGSLIVHYFCQAVPVTMGLINLPAYRKPSEAGARDMSCINIAPSTTLLTAGILDLHTSTIVLVLCILFF